MVSVEWPLGSRFPGLVSPDPTGIAGGAGSARPPGIAPITASGTTGSGNTYLSVGANAVSVGFERSGGCAVQTVPGFPTTGTAGTLVSGARGTVWATTGGVGIGPVGAGASALTLFPAYPGRKRKSPSMGKTGLTGLAEFNDGAGRARSDGGGTVNPGGLGADADGGAGKGVGFPSSVGGGVVGAGWSFVAGGAGCGTARKTGTISATGAGVIGGITGGACGVGTTPACGAVRTGIVAEMGMTAPGGEGTDPGAVPAGGAEDRVHIGAGSSFALTGAAFIGESWGC